MNRKKHHYFIFFVLSIIMVFSACSNAIEGMDSEVISAENSEELVIAFAPGSEPDTGFDPTLGWGRYGSPLFQSTLLKRNQDMEIINDLATHYSVSENGLEWRVEIRDDVKFSDGSQLSSLDVVYTFETAKESASIVDLNNLKSVSAEDDYTVIFELEEPLSTFLASLVSIGIVPKHLHTQDYRNDPVGSGPFQMVQWDKGQQLIIEPNPYYYGEDPYFQQLTILWMEEDTAFAAARSGALDITHIPSVFADQDVDGMRQINLESVDNRGIAYVMVPDEGKTTEEGYSIGNNVTSNWEIRKAIDKAVDRDLLIEGIVNGYGTKATSVSDKMPWWNEELAETIENDANPEAAIELLEENGWTLNDNGIREKDGVLAEFDLVYLVDDQVRQSLAIAVADQIKKIGINVTPVGASWDETAELMHSTPLIMGWGGYDPLEIFHLYHSDNAGIGWFNTGFYQNERVDEYLEAALSATTAEEANEYWKKAQWDGETGFSSLGDVAWTWLINIDHLYLINDDLEIGELKLQPHGRGWPITDTITEWYWAE